MDGKRVFLPGRLSGITGGLNSHRAFSRPKFPPTNFSFRQLSANNPSFPVLSATNSDVPDYNANKFSGQGFHATNFFAPNFSANTFSGSESPAFAGVWDGGIFEHRSNLPQNSGAWDGGIYEHGSNAHQNSYGGLDSCAFPIGQTEDLGLPGLGIGQDGLYLSHNFGVWDGGIYGHGFNLPQNSNNTLEALAHVSPSLGISPKEAIGDQNENTRSESVEIWQIEEVMPVDSSVQKLIGEEKVKRNGRPKIPVELADILQYDTVKDAAVNLEVSKSTLARRIKELTNKTWSMLKRSEFDRKRVCKKGRMQDKNTACACKSEI